MHRLLRYLLRSAAWAAVLALPVLGQQNTSCASCHDQVKRIKVSPHASAGCAACHPKHEAYPHPARIPKPACAQCHQSVAKEDARGVHSQARRKGNAGAPDCGVCHGDAHEVKKTGTAEFRRAVPETCGMCHTEVVEQFKISVHGKALERGIPDAPLCTDCHGEHSMLSHLQPLSFVHRSHVRETCERCHGDVRLSRRFGLPADRVISFEASFHGLAEKAGNQSVANCASCHGVHNILPSADPKSMVNVRNLPKTCGQCHPGAGRRFALGPIHMLEGGKEPPSVRWARNIYLVLIPVLIGLMTLHNLADWVGKLFRMRIRPCAGALVSAAMGAAREPRMHRFERIQHALLAASFIVLGWTGFALKYPDQWWARPLVMWEISFPARATVHRIAGAVMIAMALIHFVSLVVDRKLRHHWLELWPKAADIGEAWRNFLYILGLSSRKPRLSSHGYVEKAEYWAVVWGTLVMAVTGGMLWAVRYTLAWLPKNWLDFATAVHFYEAVLATLAVVVWHFYFVIFDPEVYPMDTAWLTGESPRKRESHDRHDPSPGPGASG